MNQNNKKMVIALVVVILAVTAVLLIKPKTKKVEETSNNVIPTTVEVLGSGTISVMPMEEKDIVTGSDYEVKLLVDAGDKNVNGVQTRICYGSELDIVDPMNDITAGENNEIILADKTEFEGKQCADVAIGANLNATLTSGLKEVAVIKFKAIAAGAGTIEILPEKTLVAGENPGSTTNKIEITNTQNLDYTVTD